MKKNKIESIRIVHQLDENPDTSFYGEYTDKLDDGVIVRQYGEYYEKLTEEEKNEMYQSSRECRYFKPYAGGEKEGTKDYYKYGMQDYDRMEKFNNGYFCFIGIYIEAVVSSDIGNGSKRLQTFSSGGLWGIESDYKEEIKEVEKEQIEDLKDHLQRFNIDLSNFDELAESAEVKEK